MFQRARLEQEEFWNPGIWTACLRVPLIAVSGLRVKGNTGLPEVDVLLFLELLAGGTNFTLSPEGQTGSGHHPRCGCEHCF